MLNLVSGTESGKASGHSAKVIRSKSKNSGSLIDATFDPTGDVFEADQKEDAELQKRSIIQKGSLRKEQRAKQRQAELAVEEAR